MQFIGPAPAYGQDSQPDVTAQPNPGSEAAIAPAPEKAEAIPDATASEAVTSKSSNVTVPDAAPTWLKLFGKAWPIILTLLITVILVKFVKDEVWRGILKAGLMGVDMIYLAYAQPAKDPNNPDVKWDPAEARARAWSEAKKQASIIGKLIFAVKGKAWGEALVHRIANHRSGKTKPAE